MSDWLLILFSAFACNYHPVKHQKLLVNANPGSASACSVFWCTHNCCNAVVSVKLAKATRKTDSALLWFCTDQGSFINIRGQELCVLIWRIWHGGVFLRSTALTWDQTEDCSKQNNTKISRQELKSLHVVYQFTWSDEEDLWWCVRIRSCESISSR